LDWNQIKEVIAVWTDLERDALHIYAALLVQVAAALVLRRRLSHWLPWAAVLAFAIGNEWLDTYRDDLVEQWELDASLHDLWNTMLLPSLLLLLVRFAPRLFAAAPAPEAPAEEPASSPAESNPQL
jgi:signal transduction histidine kinase